MKDKYCLQELTALLAVLDVQFKDICLLHQAVTHSSYANEYKTGDVHHNERLEFLGDAVLDLIVSEYLFTRFPNLTEGELTKARANVVCEQTLARYAMDLGLGQYLLLGKGETSSGGRQRVSILADAFEAIIGAIYIDSGVDAATAFVVKHFATELNLAESSDCTKDYKTLLQECVQRKNDSKIAYEVIGERGPDHNKTFEVAVNVNMNRLGTGIGKTKKEAEQHAAKSALIKLNIVMHDK